MRWGRQNRGVNSNETGASASTTSTISTKGVARWLRTGLRTGVLAGVLGLAACGALVVNPVTGEEERSVMTEADEIAQGQKAHQQVLKEYSVYDNPAVQAYVNALGQRLAAQSHRSQLQWHFTVLDSTEINAFALPGGYVYVTRGLMAYMDSEADLAGVIGHEIGHVTARHGAQRATSQQNAGLGVFAANILGIVLESQGLAGAQQAAGQISQTVAAGYIASYGREQELQADGLGAEYLARNRYDPRNMVDVITVLKNQEMYAADQAKAQGRSAPQGPDWLASHPSNDQRLDNIRQLALQYRKGAGYEDDGRERYLKVLRGLTFGDSAAQGLVRGPNFYHPDLGIALTAPSGWRWINTPQQLTMVNAGANSNGNPNGNPDAALVMQLAPASAGANRADVLRSLLQPTQANTQALTINGLPATRLTGSRSTPQGSVVVDAVAISGPADHVYVLRSTAKDAAALQRAQAGLREGINSFRPLSAADRSAAKAWVLQTKPYPAGGFAELAKSSPLPNAQQQLRLINGFYNGGEPKPGQWVKVVE